MACNISSSFGCNCGYMTNESALSSETGCGCSGCGSNNCGERVVCEWPQGFCCSRKVRDYLAASAAVDESTGLRAGEACGCACAAAEAASCACAQSGCAKSACGCRCRRRHHICCRLPF